MISGPLENLPVFLIGFMASGKSAVGLRLSSMLARPFVDLDRQIAEHAGHSIPDLIRESGEPAFRQIESELLIRASQATGAVVATGGGVVLDPRNRHLMATTGIVIWLDVPFEDCWRRIARDRESRPLAPDRETAFQRFIDRLDFYRSADLHIQSSDEQTSLETAAKIARLLSTPA